MKKIICLLLICGCITVCEGQQNQKFTIKSLVKISETGDFSALTRLVNNLSYTVIDSSNETGKSVIYFARDLVMPGNILGCFTDQKLKIQQLSFSTYSAEINKELRKEMALLGFKSEHGPGKGIPEEGITETDQFKKGNISIATYTKNPGGQSFQYGFEFLKW